MFWQRTLSAAILIAIVLSGFIWTNLIARLIPVIFLVVVAFLGIVEACRLLTKIHLEARISVAFISTAALCASALLGEIQHLPLILAAALWGCLTIEIIHRRQDFKGAIESVAGTMFALVWVGVPLAMALDLYVSSDLMTTAGVHGRRWLKLLLAVVWTTDSFAYIVGKNWRTYGRIHPLNPVSPKKTWEGAIGGFLGGGLLVPWLFSVCWPGAYPPARLGELILVSCGLSILSQIGDLGESLVKRQAAEKDSGITHTGHGGVLDIIDGLLSAGVGLWCYVWLTHPGLLS